MKRRKNACVVVLGDIGRSPRMQYHSISLAEAGYVVDIVGYGETEPMEEIKETPLLYYHYLLPCPHFPHKFVNYVLKTIWQTVNLLFVLFLLRKPDVLLVQNPPAIPSLVICWIYCKVVGSKYIIDWHNYAHSIMALSLNKGHILVRITKKIEQFFGTRADYNFCVTNAMKNDLYNNWNIRALTLYDKPPKAFHPINLKEKCSFLHRIARKFDKLSVDQNLTLFTGLIDNDVYLRKDRAGIIVSSTSWTEDEDFSVLLDALQAFEDHILNGNIKKLPNLVCFITGKGPLKEYYTEKISERNWQHVITITPWLEHKDYPLMLASADLGICLHTSSSGLDLPMKVVDMFGCGLPVCAYSFKCLDELVKHGRNGYAFSTAAELSQHIQNWFENFMNNEAQQEKGKQFKLELESFQKLRWRENWNNVVLPNLE